MSTYRILKRKRNIYNDKDKMKEITEYSIEVEKFVQLNVVDSLKKAKKYIKDLKDSLEGIAP